MRSLFNKVILIGLDCLSKEFCIASYLLIKQIWKWKQKSGWLFTALYLKQCAASLQKAYGGDTYVPELLPVPVSLTRTGYPRIIPTFHRRLIRRKDDKADRLVQLSLSFFSVAKIVQLAKKVSSSTFKSMTEPADLESVTSVTNDIRVSLHQGVLSRYLPWISTIPLQQAMVLDPTWKALPTYQVFHFPTAAIDQELKRVTGKANTRTCFLALKLEIS